MITPIEFLQEYRDKEIFLSTLPSEITDKYDVKACLKRTEYKQVYLICRKSDGMKCILKCAGIESRENLEEEYGLHHSLLHTGLVPAVEFIKKSEGSYFIREYVEGYTIAELVEMTKDGKLSDDELVEITLQLCGILEYLHSQKPPIIHRDIKPDNIIYTKQKTCKLIDFGISRRYSYEQEKDTQVLGTEYSAPPEQFGYKQTDARSDIYSIGVLMFFMATGSLDIREINSYPISRKIIKNIQKCTEFSPEDRYDTVRHLEGKLKRYKIGFNRKRLLYIGLTLITIFNLLIAGFTYFQGKNLMKALSTNAPSSNEAAESDVQASNDAVESDAQARNEAAESDAQARNEAVETDVQASNEAVETDVQASNEAVAAETPSANDPFVFTSSLIEAAVRHELGKTDTESITFGDLAYVEELYICGEQIYDDWNNHFVYGKSQYMQVQEYTQSGLYNKQGNITSLVDIKYMKNLKTLALYKQNFSDLTPLKELSDLTCLGLGTNNIQDISVLAELTNIKILDLSGNPITNDDLGVLNNLSSLEELDLGETQITSILSISNMRIRALSLWGDFVMDCDGLDAMASLEKLIVTGVDNGITEAGLSNITQLVNLKELRLMGGHQKDYSILTKLSNLKYLDLCSCDIEDLEELRGLDLDSLLFDNTQVEDLKPLQYFENLTAIGIRDIPYEDYSPLLLLTKLQYINCRKEQAEKIQEQCGEVDYTFWIQ